MRPDYSATTVSMNMHDYQKLKLAARGAAELQEEVDELKELVEKMDGKIGVVRAMRDSRDAQLTLALAEIRQLKAYVIHREDRHSEVVEGLKEKASTAEQAVVVKYLHKYADSIAALEPGESLVMQAVPAKEDLWGRDKF